MHRPSPTPPLFPYTTLFRSPPLVARHLLERPEHAERAIERLRGVLREVARARERRLLALARPRCELAGEEPEQRGLAGPVRAHDRELLALLDLDPGVRDHVGRLAV